LGHDLLHLDNPKRQWTELSVLRKLSAKNYRDRNIQTMSITMSRNKGI